MTTETTNELLDRLDALRKEATPGPWAIWDGPTFAGGGADLCIGAGDDWVTNMDHRYGANYLERIEHEAESGHIELEGWPPDCGICSFSEDATKEERNNAAYIVEACNSVPELVRRLRVAMEALDSAHTELLLAGVQSKIADIAEHRDEALSILTDALREMGETP